MYTYSLFSVDFIKHGEILVPNSTYTSSSSIDFKLSRKYFGLNPASRFFPSVETNNSSFASPVWFVHDIVTFPMSTITFTGYYFTFSIDDDEIKLILSKQSCKLFLFTFILVSQLLGITFL